MAIEKRVFHMYWLDRTTTTVMQQLSCFIGLTKRVFKNTRVEHCNEKW